MLVQEKCTMDSDLEPPLPEVGVVLSHNGRSYFVERSIYSGPFSDVYMICDASVPSKKYAMKVEKVRGIKRPVLKLDALVLPQLKGIKGFPEFIVAGKKANYKYMIMQMLGPDLGKIRMCLPNRRFSKETTMCIAMQTLCRLQALHDVGWLCRDVKAQNFAVGRELDSGTVYMLDFGFARKYRTSSSSRIRVPRSSTALLGTLRFASRRAHLSIDQSPKDDLESWFYMTLELLIGQLPWHNFTDHHSIYEAKIFYREGGRKDLFKPIENEGARKAFDEILKSIDSWKYDDHPDYSYLHYLLYVAAKEMQLDLRKPLDWQARPEAYHRAERFDFNWSDDEKENARKSITKAPPKDVKP